MNWIVLFIAGFFEVAMTFCLGKTKGAQGTELYLWIGGFVLATVLSMGLLAKAVQTLPIGTAYAIWTGVGALGTVLLGIFGKPCFRQLEKRKGAVSAQTLFVFLSGGNVEFFLELAHGDQGDAEHGKSPFVFPIVYHFQTGNAT